MSLSDYYKRQGQTVLDLGCGVGDQAAELVAP